MSVVIAARNEEKSIGEVIHRMSACLPNSELIIVDDESQDRTAQIAQRAGARVLRNERRIGQTASLRRGMASAQGMVIVTLDADLEHRPEDVISLLDSLDNDEAGVVIGGRVALPRWSEYVLSYLMESRTGVRDTITGFRAIRREVLERVGFDVKETWGAIMLLRCSSQGVKIIEKPVTKVPPRAEGRTGNRIVSNLRVLRCVFYALIELALGPSSGLCERITY